MSSSGRKLKCSLPNFPYQQFRHLKESDQSDWLSRHYSEKQIKIFKPTARRKLPEKSLKDDEDSGNDDAVKQVAAFQGMSAI